METSAEIQSIIRQKFQSLHTKEDLLCLLNLAKPYVFGKKTKPFYLNQLTYYYGSQKHIVKYQTFSIRKKSGKDRIIHAPVSGLKAIQRTLAFILETVYEPHESAYGFRKASSIADNAAKHVGSRYVYNIDLKDFFPSIDQARIWKCLQLKPFLIGKKDITGIYKLSDPQITILNQFDGDYLKPTLATRISCKYEGINLMNGRGETKNENGERIIYNITVKHHKRDSGFINFHLIDSVNEIFTGVKNISQSDIESCIEAICKQQETLIQLVPKHTAANIIASLCCTEMEVERKNENGEWIKFVRNVLPQGAPTSPVITNIVCRRLDILLTGLAKRFGLKYSRYADDITFSSEHNVYQADSDFSNELNRIINNQGFHIKESKTRLQKSEYRQEVTGLLVNKKINVQKRYIKQLRTWIHLLEKKPHSQARSIIKEQYLKDKGHVKKESVNIENIIRGKLAYLKMIKGETCNQYIQLKNRLDNALSNKKGSKVKNKITISSAMPVKELYKAPSSTYTIDDPHLLLEEIIEKGLDAAMDNDKPLF